MASYSFLAPRPTNAILSDVDHIREIQWVLAQWNPSLADDAPEDSKRLVPLDSAKTQYRFERLTGSSWNSVGKLMHDVDTLDGYHASISAIKNTIPVYNADAQLVGDLTGNANTATTLKNIRKLQIGGIASGGSSNFDGSADATIEIVQLTVNNANDTAINGVLTVKHGGTGGADAATARANLGVPAIDHSSTAKTFGVASTTKYGHVIGSDALNSTFTADKGYFFSPKGADDLNSTLRALIAQKLSLSGGTLSGTLTGTAYEQMCGSIDQSVTPSENQYGSSIRFLDKNKVPVGRMTVFRRVGGTTVLRLSSLLPDGENGTHLDLLTGDGVQKMQLLGKDVLTSDGGLITGPIKRNGGDVLLNAGTSGAIYLCGGSTRADGSYIMLKPKQHSNNAGEMSLVTVGADGASKELNLRANGTFTWGGKSVITSAGGLLTGELIKDSSHDLVARHATNAGQVSFRGGRDYKEGSDIVLFGKDFDNPNFAGTVLLRAYTNSGNTDVQVRGDGLYVSGQSVITSGGGTITGNLNLSNDGLLRRTMQPYKGVGLVNSVEAGLYVFSHDSTHQANSVLLRARSSDASKIYDLWMESSGAISFNNNPLVPVVDHWQSGHNFYIKYANGLLIQGGILGFSAGVSGGYEAYADVNFWTPFTHSYTAWSNVFGTGMVACCAEDYQLTSMRVKGLAYGQWREWTGVSWLAIGM